MDMLINQQMFSYINDNKRKGSKELFIAFPVVAYKVEAVVDIKSGDPVSNAVNRLNKFYHSEKYLLEEEKKREDVNYRKQPQKSIASMIAYDLDISEELVKCIIEREEQRQEQSLDDSDNDFVSGKNNGEALQRYEEKTVTKFYVFFDRISQRYLPWFIDEKEYDNMKEDVEDPKQYRVSLGDSSVKSISYLKTTNDGYPYGGPNQEKIEEILSSYNGNHNGKARYKIQDVDTSFRLLTGCFYFHNNPYSYSVMNPFKQSTAQWMQASVKEWANSGINYGIDIARELESIKPKNNENSTAKKSKTEADLDARFNKFVSVYSKKREVVAALMPRFSELFKSYARLRQLYSDNEPVALRAQGRIFEKISKQNYLIALYSFFEDAFAKCAKQYYLTGDAQRYHRNVLLLQNDENNGDELFRLASEVGFRAEESDRALFSGEKLNCNKVNYFLEHSDTQESDVNESETEETTYLLSTSVYVNLIEAKENPKHPFRQLAKMWDTLLTTAISVKSVRNKAKHGYVYALDSNYYDLYHAATDVFQVVCGLSDEELNHLPKLDDLNGNTEWREEFESAYDKAKAEIESHKITESNVDLNEKAMFESLSFTMREVEYYAKLSNLYDEILSQLIQVKYTSPSLVARQLGEQNNVSARAAGILTTNGARSMEMLDKSEFRRSGQLKYSKQLLEKVSVRNKLLYYILRENDKNPQWLSNQDVRSNVQMLCDNVCKVERMRGHNNQADFDKERDELNTLHEQALLLCNKMILTKGE